jgi:hypothetical protein
VPDVDIFVQGPNARFEKVAYMHASDYAQMPAGIYDIQLRVAGTDQVIFTVNQFNADGGHIHSLAAAGGVNRRVEVVEMYDAVSAAVTPAEAPKTGEGGLAHGQAAGYALGVLAIALLSVLVLPVIAALAPRRISLR